MTINKPLGARIVPPEKKRWAISYALKLDETPITKPTSIAMGVPWYEDFDRPVLKSDGTYWIGLDVNKLGEIRGGHCVCIPYDHRKDRMAWYRYYNQLNQGACVGTGVSRTMSQMNRKMYDWTWLWNEAKKIDPWADTNPGDDEGTSVAAAMDVLRIQGHRRKVGGKIVLEEGIVANRWANNVQDLFSVVKNAEYSKLGALPILNSWGEFNPRTGEGYPRVVFMPAETHDFLLRDGWAEYTMFTDR